MHADIASTTQRTYNMHITHGKHTKTTLSLRSAAIVMCDRVQDSLAAPISETK